MNTLMIVTPGRLVVVLATVVSITGRLVARRQAANHPDSEKAKRVTPAGLVLCVLILGGYAIRNWAPASVIGSLLRPGLAFAVYAGLLVVVARVLERMLARKGIFLLAGQDRER